jgi:hypothetical protein
MRAPPPVPLLLLLVPLALPSVARAQQPPPPIPPVGEPPPPETRLQERAAIEAQERQAYEQANQDQLYRQAVSEVEAERRRAWDQRGRDAVPPPARGKLPVIEPNILARIGSAGDNVLVMGPSAALKLRMRRYWGLEAAGGILWARDYSSPPPPSSRFVAAFSEVSALGWLSKASGKYAEADHAFLRAGFQLAFPISTPNVPSVYLAPFASIGGVFALGPLYRGKGYAAILFETRFGHRFGLGSSATSPMEGFMVDILTGPAVGF